MNDTCATFDLNISARASSFAWFFEERARLSITGAISGSLCSADLRARRAGEGREGRVDWWSCLALRREKRS